MYHICRKLTFSKFFFLSPFKSSSHTGSLLVHFPLPHYNFKLVLILRQFWRQSDFNSLEKLIMEKTAWLQKDFAQLPNPQTSFVFFGTSSYYYLSFLFWLSFSFFFLNCIYQCQGTLACSIKPNDKTFKNNHTLQSREAHQSRSCV